MTTVVDPTYVSPIHVSMKLVLVLFTVNLHPQNHRWEHFFLAGQVQGVRWQLESRLHLERDGKLRPCDTHRQPVLSLRPL